ncbi:transglutaminase domain-containing protein, partial [Clostridioides difficile]|nr:transglutaminase domain-containing protein [Clostridioides difficile]EGT4944978.1 transglutaminase domain-containing protein [Clostridioides difficile]EGT5014624.1 transglutaminase domain-containing protein [Clostridioides difficile]HBH3667877.1 transglutaminase domain-containing protein [Clostridioides difficile]
QWNLIRFGDGRLYHVDIDANKSAGKDIIYKSLTHPLPFDKTAYPKVGAIVQTVKPEQTQKPAPPGKHTMLPHQEGAKAVGKLGDIKDKHVMYEGVRCIVINSSVNTVTFIGSKSNLDPSKLVIAVIGFMNTPYGMFALAPEGNPVEYPFEYDKPFSLDFSGKNRSGVELAKYCKENDVTIKIEITDKEANNGIGQVMYIRYE